MSKPNPGIVTTAKSTMKYDRELTDTVAAKAREEFGSYAEFLRIVHELYRDGKLKVGRSVAEARIVTDRDTGDEG